MPLSMNTVKDRPKLSVVIVTYNRSDMLRDALRSLVVQTRLPDEVIVVDNNSSDDTKQVVDTFNRELKINYLLERTQGTSIARNTGIKAASGDIVVFLDDDCVAEKEWLHYLELPFLRDPSIGIVGGEIRACRVKGTFVEDYCIADAMMKFVSDKNERGST